jgi:Tol biopolymer transport system component
LVSAIAAGPALSADPTSESSDAGEPLLSNIRQLIFEGRRSGEGYFSADGSMLIFQSEREPDNPFYQIYLMDLETGDTSRISPGIGKTTCAWIHPSGEKVLFASTHEDPAAVAKQEEELAKRAQGQGSRYAWSFDAHFDIYQADSTGQNLRPLTRAPGYDAEGSWSPDGRRIVFASNRHAYAQELPPAEQSIFERDKSYFMDIYVMDADGENLRRLTRSPGYDGGPFFSPDGRRIVWRRFDDSGHKAEIWTMDVDGDDQRQITRLGALSWAPFYHPSGEYIIFATNKHGYANFELYLVDTAGAVEPVRVTHSPGFDGLPVFAPEGTRLAWASTRTVDERAQIFFADWDHEQARRMLGLTATPQTQPRAGDAAPAVPDFDRTGWRISAADLRQHVGYLADPGLEGRLTGSPGAHLATEYVANAFDALNLQPAGDTATWYQAFEFTAGVSLGSGNRLILDSPTGRDELTPDRDWRPLAFSPNGDVPPAGVSFAGYGITAPATEEFAPYDAYADLEVADRWVMVFRFMPEAIPAEQRQHLMHYAELRYKAMVARDKGARGLIVVSGPNSGVREELVKMSREGAVASGGFPVISITDAVAERLLAPSGRSLAALQDALDEGSSQPGFEVPSLSLAARIDIRKERRVGRNALGLLRVADAPTDELVIVGAHVDHIGRGDGLDSLASGDDVGKIHPGADDNASGVAGLLEIAQYLAHLHHTGRLGARRDILFAAWSGEELGVLGSNHFVKTFGSGAEEPDSLRPRVSSYLNLDMIGRLQDKLYLQGVGSSLDWAGEIERRNAPVGLPIVTQRDSYLPTDATPFYLKGVPVLNAFTGAHSQYNTPADTADTLNYPGAARVARLMALLTRSLARSEAAPAYVRMEKPAATVSRRNLRAYLGTIPEYADSAVSGVALTGVARGGPADQAGLREGDIIVGLAGRRVENIYDYTYALNACRVGQAVEVIVNRDGEEIALEVLPGSRE